MDAPVWLASSWLRSRFLAISDPEIGALFLDGDDAAIEAVTEQRALDAFAAAGGEIG